LYATSQRKLHKANIALSETTNQYVSDIDSMLNGMLRVDELRQIIEKKEQNVQQSEKESLQLRDERDHLQS